MKAKKKPLEKKKVSDFEFDAKNRLKTLKVTGKLLSSCLTVFFLKYVFN